MARTKHETGRQRAETKIARLEADIDRAEQEIVALNLELSALETMLPELRASAERSPDPERETTLSRSENRVKEIEGLVLRKQSLIDVLAGELKQAEQEKLDAAQDDRRAKIKIAYALAGQLADELDANPKDAGKWTQLSKLLAEHAGLIEAFKQDILEQDRFLSPHAIPGKIGAPYGNPLNPLHNALSIWARGFVLEILQAAGLASSLSMREARQFANQQPISLRAALGIQTNGKH